MALWLINMTKLRPMVTPRMTTMAMVRVALRKALRTPLSRTLMTPSSLAAQDVGGSDPADHPGGRAAGQSGDGDRRHQALEDDSAADLAGDVGQAAEGGIAGTEQAAGAGVGADPAVGDE